MNPMHIFRSAGSYERSYADHRAVLADLPQNLLPGDSTE